MRNKDPPCIIIERVCIGRKIRVLQHRRLRFGLNADTLITGLLKQIVQHLAMAHQIQQPHLLSHLQRGLVVCRRDSVRISLRSGAFRFRIV